MTTEIIYREGTIEIWAYFQDEDDNYVSPDQGVFITIWDSKGTAKITAQPMSENAPGKFVYYYTPAADVERGSWTYYYKGQDGSGATAKIGNGWGAFEVK
jgi:hypothetical protein